MTYKTRAEKRDYSTLPIISRESASDAGMTHYFTGDKCSKGHLAPRYVKSDNCVVCMARTTYEWHAKMYREQPDEIRRRNRAKRHADPIGEIIRVVRSRAKKKKLDFSITRGDVRLPEKCPCCARKIIPASGKNKQGGRPESPSIDRIDPARGYVPGNVAVICWRCNELKRNGTIEELRAVLSWMESVGAPKTRLNVVA